MAAGTAGCPAPDELERLLGETLADADRTSIESHVETCAACQERLERLVGGTLHVTRRTVVTPPGAKPDEAFLARLRRLPLPPTPEPGATEGEPAPSQLGPYEILGRLGGGGMGTVYRARHRELDKVVALKVLPADRVDEAVVARFRNEMKAAGRLAHPNIVAAHDAGRVGGTYYLAMDFVDGADLSALVERLGPLPVPDACELIRQAAVGLQHACECGLAHRDVKPSNLILARGGVVKVLDLGLARSLADLPEPDRLTATGMLLGTADYVAPEQIDKAHTADTRADVYGLGGTLYFLLTGAPPFASYRSWLEKLRAHVEAPVPSVRQQRAEVPAALAELLERMLAKKPDDRPATPGEVAAALQAFTAGADPSALLAREDVAPRPPAPDTPRARRRARGVVAGYALAAVAGAAVALASAAPFFARNRDRMPDPQPPGGAPAALPVKSDEKGAAEEPEGIRMTYGSGGSPCPDHKVFPGEEVHFEYFVRGVGKDRKGEVDVTVASELLDREGKKLIELAPVPIRGPLYHGGSSVFGDLSFRLPLDQAPGEYKVRARVTDRVTGRSVDFQHPVYVLRPEFGAVRVRLTHDEKGEWPAGSHLTVGQQFHVQMRIMNFEHKDGRIHIIVKLSALDRDGKDTMLAPIKPLNIDQKVEDAFTYFDLRPPALRTVMAGEAVIKVELEDVIGGKKVSYELPVMIHPPRSIRAPVKEK